MHELQTPARLHGEHGGFKEQGRPPLGAVRRQTLQLQIAQANRKITREGDGREVSGYWIHFSSEEVSGLSLAGHRIWTPVMVETEG